MDAVKKAASGAVDTIRNSPLFRRKFGTQNRAELEEEEPRPLSPERDTTPFVQGINFQVRTSSLASRSHLHCLVTYHFLCVFTRYPIWAADWCPACWPRTTV